MKRCALQGCGKKARASCGRGRTPTYCSVEHQLEAVRRTGAERTRRYRKRLAARGIP